MKEEIIELIKERLEAATKALKAYRNEGRGYEAKFHDGAKKALEALLADIEKTEASLGKGQESAPSKQATPPSSPAWADAIARELEKRSFARLPSIDPPWIEMTADLLTERFGPVVEALTLCRELTEERGLKKQIDNALARLHGER